MNIHTIGKELNFTEDKFSAFLTLLLKERLRAVFDRIDACMILPDLVRAMGGWST